MANRVRQRAGGPWESADEVAATFLPPLTAVDKLDPREDLSPKQPPP